MKIMFLDIEKANKVTEFYSCSGYMRFQFSLQIEIMFLEVKKANEIERFFFFFFFFFYTWLL